VGRRRLQPVEIPLDTILILHSIHRLSSMSNFNKFLVTTPTQFQSFELNQSIL
jgi:hypothetical protein